MPGGTTAAELRAEVDRLLAHLDGHTTDRAPSVYRASVATYADAAQWAFEERALFEQRPVAVALSADIVNAGDYRALTLLDRPILVIRDSSGVARTFLNVCRHRGAQLVEEGLGNARRLTCPYHAWSYATDGALVQVAAAETFGFDGKGRDLAELPTFEAHGLVFCCMDPTVQVDIDGWLAGFDEELASLRLAEWVPYRRWQLEGPNWKVCMDGYLEGYHFAALHKDTVNRSTHSNVAVVRQWGPHQRLLFPLRTIGQLRDQPTEEWDLKRHVAPVHVLFPNFAIASAWSNLALVSQILPQGPDRSVTHQTILCRRELATDADRAEAEVNSDFYFHVVKNEDYTTAHGVQRGLRAGANSEFLFGRNEPALQHFHRSLDLMLARPATAEVVA